MVDKIDPSAASTVTVSSLDSLNGRVSIPQNYWLKFVSIARCNSRHTDSCLCPITFNVTSEETFLWTFSPWKTKLSFRAGDSVARRSEPTNIFLNVVALFNLVSMVFIHCVCVFVTCSCSHAWRFRRRLARTERHGNSRIGLARECTFERMAKKKKTRKIWSKKKERIPW